MSIHTKESVRGTILSDRYAWPSFQAAEEFAAGTVQNPSASFLWGYGGGRVLSGMPVNAESAARVSAAYACGQAISEDIGKLPFKLYKYLENGRGKQPDPQHPLYTILALQPNHWQTAIEFRQMLQWHLLFRGNGYAEIIRDRAANVTALLPLHPERVQMHVEPSDGAIFYKVMRRNGQRPTLPQRDVFHLRGLTRDGYLGVSAISAAPEVFGLALAAEAHDATLLAKGATLPGAVKLEKSNPNEEDKQTARDTWQAIHGGALYAGTAAMFYGGMSWVDIGISPKDLQILEMRQAQIPEVARMFRMQLHKIAELSRSTNNNIEQQAREYIDDTLYFWFVVWEQAVTRDLLLPEERLSHFAKFNPDALLRGDTLSRYRANQIACGRPWVTGNEIRMDREDMNASDDPTMDEVALPLNIGASAQASAAADKQIDENNRPAPPPANGKGSLPAGAAQ